MFLDIELSGMSGITTVAKLKELNPHVIIFIVTSFMEYLDSAMEIHVFRYLNKPIDKLRLFRNLKDALRIYNAQSLHITIETKSEVYTVYTNYTDKFKERKVKSRRTLRSPGLFSIHDLTEYNRHSCTDSRRHNPRPHDRRWIHTPVLAPKGNNIHGD